ncbi:putative serine/threonine-protein kinase PBL22 [Cardamine amara subsp. amara]|uniref:non-specific serine/threonine protein kinase n=1 Tax=Cardamine amara subsp. amara TaxID=228776 RepID=A0ABD1API1_CARAN
MKGILCCFGKASANNVVQETAQPSEPPQQPQPTEPPQQPQATDSSVRVDDKNAEVNDEAPFGDNAFLNNAWIHNLQIPDSSANVYPSYPRLPADSGAPFAWRQIVNGTQNFRETNFLGRGNFGDVYRCNFPRIDKVGAVKIQKPSNEAGPHEFIAEVTTLRAANHLNVIKLLGTCYTRKNRVLVYEFMPKGSLDQYLFGAKTRQGQVLDWNTRIKIALGVADGLKYLHIKRKTIHGDIKPGNILLDENFVPKLTDFGLAVKLVENEYGVEEQQSVISTNNTIKGTRGFIAPETEQLGLISTMSDVYSFGVFLLVLFTGRKAYDVQRPPATRKIIDWLKPVWNKTRSPSLVVDPALGTKYSKEGLNRLFSFGVKMCIDAQVEQRADMYCMEMLIRQVEAFTVPEVPARHSL